MNALFITRKMASCFSSRHLFRTKRLRIDQTKKPSIANAPTADTPDAFGDGVSCAWMERLLGVAKGQPPSGNAKDVIKASSSSTLTSTAKANTSALTPKRSFRTRRSFDCNKAKVLDTIVLLDANHGVSCMSPRASATVSGLDSVSHFWGICSFRFWHLEALSTNSNGLVEQQQALVPAGRTGRMRQDHANWEEEMTT